MVSQKPAKDDFFSMLAQDDSTQLQGASSQSPNVVVFKDADGTMKQLVNGVVQPLSDDAAIDATLQKKNAASFVSEKKAEQPQIDQSAKKDQAQSKIPKPVTVQASSKVVAQQMSAPKPTVLLAKNPLAAKQVDEALEFAQRVEKEAKIMFADSQLRSRFEKLLLSYIKGVRSRVQLRDTLGRDVAMGGIGLKQEEITKVVQLLDTHSSKQKQGNQNLVKQQIDAPAITFHPPKELPRRPSPEVQQQIDSLVKGVPPISVSPRVEVKPSTAAISNQPSVAKPATKPTPTPQQKPRIDDVVFKPKSVGPIEELEMLSVKDFRSLAATPEASAAKVEEKIDLMEQESFVKRLEAIKAWKQSDVYQLYIDLGHESIEGAKNIEDIITSRTEQKEPTLTIEEFNAVSELNSRLRY